MSISPQRHRLQANINNNLAQQVLPINPPWAVVIAFYAALHYLDEYASYCGVCFIGHTDRRSWLRDRVELRSIEYQYEKLYKRSRLARYDCPSPDHSFLTSNAVTQVLPLVIEIRDGITIAEKQAGFISA